jgi:hypothetical protein
MAHQMQMAPQLLLPSVISKYTSASPQLQPNW